MAKRVLSGMQPSGVLHLGNLFGALDNFLRLQAEHECFYFVADWHALSTNYEDTTRIREYTREVLIDWLATGLDPERSTLFIQSHVPEHAILHLLLSMITPVPWLERNPTYKEKQENLEGRDLSTYGFLGYPVLQAADILLYKGDYVPVGVDQRGIHHVLRDEPDLHLVGADDVADQQVVGAVVARLGRLAGHGPRLLEDDLVRV